MIAQLVEQGKGIVSTDSKGRVQTVLLQKPVEVSTKAGVFVPSVSTSGDDGIDTRKKEAPVKFYPSGRLRSLPLEEAAQITTSVGKLEAELLTFYESGSVKRVFPLNGKISGFWSEKDEYKLAPEIEIDCYGRIMRLKPIYLQFYETGELESIAFWPSDRALFDTPIGTIVARNGVSFYKSGKVRSIEPVQPIVVSTAIGPIEAFDPDPEGVCAETASLCFSPQGEVTSLSTSACTVAVTREDGTASEYSPLEVKSMCSDLVTAISPLKICIADKAAVFGRGHKVIGSEPLTGTFSVGLYSPPAKEKDACADDCSFGCAGCGA